MNSQGRQQNPSLGINRIDNAELCFPHDNIVGGHLYGACMKSNELNIDHKFLSILWLLLQACSLTTRCQVVHFVPDTSISGQFASRLLTILQQNQVPLFLMIITQARTWDFVQLLSFCLPVRNIFQRIFWACPSISKDHATVFAWGFFPTLVIFQLLQQKFVIRTFFSIHW